MATGGETKKIKKNADNKGGVRDKYLYVSRAFRTYCSLPVRCSRKLERSLAAKF